MSNQYYINDVVNRQLSERDDMISAPLSRVLLIYTGGTIGMKNTPSHGYCPVSGYLSQTLASMNRFHDPSGFAAETLSKLQDTVVDANSVFPLTNPVNVPLDYPTEQDFTPPNMSNESSSESPSLSTPLHSIQEQSPTVKSLKRHNSSTFYINGTPVMRTRKAALITPLSLYGKRIRYSILEYEPLLDSSNMTMKV